MNFLPLKIKSLMQNQKPGFSLVELMVVMAIVGVLLAFGVPAYKKYKSNARIKAHKASLQNLHSAVIVLDSTDELSDDKAEVIDQLREKVQGLKSASGIDFQYGADKNDWCISFDQTKAAKNLKACINQDGEIRWIRKNNTGGVCGGGACVGEAEPL